MFTRCTLQDDPWRRHPIRGAEQGCATTARRHTDRSARSTSHRSALWLGFQGKRGRGPWISSETRFSPRAPALPFFFPLLSVIDNRPVVQLWSTAPPPCPPVLGLLLGCKPYSPTLPHISSHQTTPHRGPPVPTPVRRGRSPTGRASPAFSELRVSRACPKLLYTLFLRHSTTWLSGARIVPDGTADITLVEVLSRTVGATLA